MARNQGLLVNWTQYLALRAIGAVTQWFPTEENLRSAAAIGSLYYRLNGTRRDRAHLNIAASFPHMSPEEVADCAERSMQHMFQLFLVDALAMPRLVTPATWTRHLTLDASIGRALERLVRNEPLILLTGHCGSWEMLGFAMAVLGFPTTALARPIDNPIIDRWLLAQREAGGLRVLTKWGAIPALHETIERGGRVGFIADQNAGDNGLFVPFFGRLASSYKSIALLAMRHEVPIIAGHARRLPGDMRYEIAVHDVIEPAEWVDRPDPMFYITARYGRAIESMIRAAPDQYLWLHRRWKSRPPHEREGRPFPSRLRRKLEELPWMTQVELDELVAGSEREAASHRIGATCDSPTAAS